MGNILSGLIPDMNTIREEGFLYISSELAAKLKINDSDKVKLSSEFGKSKQKVKIISDLNGELAYFKPTWDHVSLFNNGLNINQNVIPVKIEK